MTKNDIAELMSSGAELINALKGNGATSATSSELQVSLTPDDEKACEERIRSMQLAIEEQRHVYDGLVENYHQTKSRILAFLAAGFAILTFLYAGGDTFFPAQVYGQVFYLAALGLLAIGFGLLFVALQANQWELPTERSRLVKLDFNTHFEYLKYVRDRYLMCFDRNSGVCERKHKLLRHSFYPLVIGAIILVLLKLFKEQI